MEDELLTDILAAEREVRMQIDSMEQQSAERLERLGQELDRMMGDESALLLNELEKARIIAEQTSEQEAEAILAEARVFALRLENLGTEELDRVVHSYLTRINPEGTNDCQDEQA
jgi:hypothetical protein